MELTQALRIAQNPRHRADEELREAQTVLGDEIWDRSPLEQTTRRAAYHIIRGELETRYAEGECHANDPWSWDTFSDVYKDDNGWRPKAGSGWDGPTVRAYLNQRQIKSWFEILQDHAEDMAG